MPSRRRRRPLLGWILALACALLLAAVLWNPAVAESDVLQPRASWAPPALSPDAPLAQTFVAPHDGLDAIEVLVARYRPSEPLPAGAQVCLQLQSLPSEALLIQPLCIDAAPLGHNAPLTFRFAEIRGVAGATLRATFWTTAPTDLTLWASAEEAYAPGALYLAGGAPADSDLRLTLHYRYRLTDALAELGDMARSWWAPLCGLALLLGGPGLALGLLLARRQAPVYALPLALAFWPLLLLWLTALHLPFAAATIWLATATSWLGVAAYLARHRPARLRLLATVRSPTTALLALVTLLSLAMRLLNVRSLVVPSWVDSLHHSVIVQLILEQHALPNTGDPYVSLPGFYYHFGFHALAAALAQIARLPSYRAVLIVGQALLALAPVGVYGLVRGLTGRRLEALLGALVVACWSYMPAYYASWGRYPQMAGLLLLTGALLAVWRLARPPTAPWRTRILAGVLVAGLLVTHYRISALLVPWGGLALVALLTIRGSDRRRGTLVASVTALGLALLLAAPWLWRLAEQFAPQFGETYGTLVASPAADDAWPSNLLTYRWTPVLLGGAAVGAIWALLRRQWRMALLALWAGLCVLLPNLQWLGLPDLWLVNNTAVVIAYWLPVGALCGWLLGDLAHLGAHWWRRHARFERLAQIGAAALLVATAYVGSWLHLDVLNTSTVLATPADIDAAAWMRDNLPPDALILVNSAHWSNTARRGTDAGWWLPLLAGRRVTLPNLLYIQGGAERFAAINSLAIAVEEAQDDCAPSLLALLRERGVTHVYIGAQGGPLLPEKLTHCPAYTLLYSVGPTRVYALDGGN
ncbi:MAG: DUF6541 family protein [Anaerolineales bacterium]